MQSLLVVLAVTAVLVQSGYAAVVGARFQQQCPPPSLVGCGRPCGDDSHCAAPIESCCIGPCGKTCTSPFKKETEMARSQQQCPPPPLVGCGRPCAEDYHCAAPIESCCAGPCGKTCTINIYQKQTEMARSQQQCPPPFVIACGGRPCAEDYHCAPFESCCDGPCGKTCTSPIYQKQTDLAAQAQQQIGVCFPPDVILCDGRGCDQCAPNERCCLGSCGQPTCTNLFQNKLEMALAQQQQQCPIVCEPPSSTNKIPCRQQSDCPGPLGCCPNLCGPGKLCTEPVAKIAGENPASDEPPTSKELTLEEAFLEAFAKKNN